MSIKSGQMTGLIALTAATDLTIANPDPKTTEEYYNLVVQDSAGTGATVELFLSDDSTSAAGERIDRVVLAANETKSFLPVGVPASKFLIAKADAAGVTLHGEYIYRDGADV